jgi:dienelactone hydrolase
VLFVADGPPFLDDRQSHTARSQRCGNSSATIPPAAEKVKELGKVYITHIYQGAGHGFLRAQDERNGTNLEASRQAWPATNEFLKKNLEQAFAQRHQGFSL